MLDLYDFPSTDNQCQTNIFSPGYTCEEHNNPSDFFLDVLSDMVMPSSQLGDSNILKHGKSVSIRLQMLYVTK